MSAPKDTPEITLVVATRNAGKAREFAALLDGLPLRLETLADYRDVPEAPEAGETYLENARAKALLVARVTGKPALADDSGLEVDALGGRPGVRSGRYSGGGPRENIALLLRELRTVPAAQRTARFRCVLVAAHPDGRTLAAEGVCEGYIADAPRGTAGFGYDPVFIDSASGLSFAEIPSSRKNRLSHRARAVEALRPRLMRFLGDPDATDS